MKTPQILNLILAAALIIVVVKSAMSSGDEAASGADQMGAIEAIMTRSSVRAYSAEAVSAEAVETMLKAGMAAPTGGNRQPWRFVVIDDKAILDQIPAIIGGAKMADKAPMAIAVCGVPAEGMLEYWIQDTSAATENILLAAHAIGLGAVWCGVYPDVNGRVGKIQCLLNMPEDVVPLSIIVIGHPEEGAEPHVKDKWMPEKVSYNQYDRE